MRIVGVLLTVVGGMLTFGGSGLDVLAGMITVLVGGYLIGTARR